MPFLVRILTELFDPSFATGRGDRLSVGLREGMSYHARAINHMVFVQHSVLFNTHSHCRLSCRSLRYICRETPPAPVETEPRTKTLPLHLHRSIDTQQWLFPGVSCRQLLAASPFHFVTAVHVPPRQRIAATPPPTNSPICRFCSVFRVC